MARKKKYEAMSFEDLAPVIHQYLLDEGLALNLQGFRDVLRRYFRLQDNNLLDIHEVMLECNLWYGYFSEIQSVTELFKEDWLLKSERLLAQEKKAEPSEELEAKIQHAKLRSKHFSMFSKHVEHQKKFFWKASGHCQFLYKRGLLSMTRS